MGLSDIYLLHLNEIHCDLFHQPKAAKQVIGNNAVFADSSFPITEAAIIAASPDFMMLQTALFCNQNISTCNFLRTVKSDKISVIFARLFPQWFYRGKKDLNLVFV